MTIHIKAVKMYIDINNPNTNSLYYNKTGAWVVSDSRAM